MIQRTTFIFLLVSLLGVSLIGQEHFLVELENRSPDVQAMVRGFEGSQAIPFLADDVNGVQQSFMDMRGKTVILWFWNNDCPMCHNQIADLNLLKQNHGDKLEIISFSDNTKDEIRQFVQSRPVDFPIIPNSKTLAEGPYGGDLGYPKIFVVDPDGKVKWAIPEIEMRGDFKTYNFLETLHVSLYK